MGILDGKTAIVTGGAGALGAAVVTTLLDAGATLAVPYHLAGDLDALRERAGISSEAGLSGALLDLTDEEAVARYYAAVAGQSGSIDALVNIAGGFAGGSPVHETPWSLWQQQIDM